MVSWKLNTLLRRWLYTPIIIRQDDWIPKDRNVFKDLFFWALRIAQSRWCYGMDPKNSEMVGGNVGKLCFMFGLIILVQSKNRGIIINVQIYPENIIIWHNYIWLQYTYMYYTHRIHVCGIYLYSVDLYSKLVARYTMHVSDMGITTY